MMELHGSARSGALLYLMEIETFLWKIAELALYNRACSVFLGFQPNRAS